MNRQVIFPIPSFTGQAGSSKCPAQVDFAVILHYRTPCLDFSRVKGCSPCTCTPRGNRAAHHATISPTGLQSGRDQGPAAGVVQPAVVQITSRHTAPHPELYHPAVGMQIRALKPCSLPRTTPFTLQTLISTGCCGLLKNGVSLTPQKSSFV